MDPNYKNVKTTNLQLGICEKDRLYSKISCVPIFGPTLVSRVLERRGMKSFPNA
jgi:hypothetical protein